MYQGSNVIFWAIDVLKVGNRQELLLALATKTTVRIRIWRRNLEFSAVKMQRKHQLVLISGKVFVTERSGRKNGGFEPSCLSGWFEETQTRELTQTRPLRSCLTSVSIILPSSLSLPPPSSGLNTSCSGLRNRNASFVPFKKINKKRINSAKRTSN